MTELSVSQARAALNDALVTGEASVCPCCDQFVKLYRRKLNAGMAVSLVKLFRSVGTSYAHVPSTVGRESADQALLRYWGLLEEDGSRTGYWRVTALGEQFVLGKVTVRSHVLLYNGRFLGLDGEQVTIQECLGEKFSYLELIHS